MGELPEYLLNIDFIFNRFYLFWMKLISEYFYIGPIRKELAEFWAMVFFYGWTGLGLGKMGELGLGWDV